MANVGFFRLDASFATQGEFVAAVRWQNVTGDWRSWLAFTDDDGATWSWQSVSAGDTLPVWGALNQISVNDDMSSPTGWTAGGEAEMIAVLSPTKVVLSHVGDEIEGWYIEACVANISGGTITEGDWYRLDTEVNHANNPKNSALVEMDDSTFAYVWIQWDEISSYVLTAVAGTIVGTVISVGTQQRPGFEATTDVSIARLSDTAAVVAASSSGGRGACWILTVSGNSVSWSSSEEDFTSSGGEVTVEALSATKFVVFYEESNDVYAKIGTIAGSNISFGSAYQIMIDITNVADNVACAALSDSLVIFAWHETDLSPLTRYKYVRAGSVSGTVITLGTEKDFAASGGNANIWVGLDRIDSGTFVMQYHNTGDDDPIQIGSVSGTTITLTGPWDDGGIGVRHDSQIRYLGSDKGILYSSDETGDNTMWAQIISGLSKTLEIYTTGMSIGKGAGALVYSTGCDGSNLFVKSYTLPALAASNELALGGATFAEILAETWIAWPFGAFGLDDAVYVHGRMDDPDSLGSPSHIIYSGDEAVSFSLLEGDWAADTCGAFFAFGFLAIAIRNAGSRAKVYLWNGSSFDLKSTSSLNAGVKVKAIAVDYRDMTLVLCSEVGDTIMVVLSIYPYVEWNDITSNHPNSSSVFAAEIL
jgi:hypothetical protein